LDVKIDSHVRAGFMFDVKFLKLLNFKSYSVNLLIKYIRKNKQQVYAGLKHWSYVSYT